MPDLLKGPKHFWDNYGNSYNYCKSLWKTCFSIKPQKSNPVGYDQAIAQARQYQRDIYCKNLELYNCAHYQALFNFIFKRVQISLWNERIIIKETLLWVFHIFLPKYKSQSGAILLSCKNRRLFLMMSAINCLIWSNNLICKLLIFLILPSVSLTKQFQCFTSLGKWEFHIYHKYLSNFVFLDREFCSSSTFFHNFYICW